MNVYLDVILIGLGIVSLGFTCIQLWFYWIIKTDDVLLDGLGSAVFGRTFLF